MTDVRLPYVGDMPDAEYFAYPAWDQTQLKRWADSPSRWAAGQAGGHATPAMLMGTAAHALVLGSGEPVKVGRNPKDTPEGVGPTYLTRSAYDAVTRMAAVTHPVFQRIGGQPEVTMIARDPMSGLVLKGKADWLPAAPDDSGVYWVYDYKTTGMPLTAFGRAAAQGGYDVQAAFYIRLYRLTHPECGRVGFRFLAQEKTPPYDYTVQELAPGSPVLVDADAFITAVLTDIRDFPYPLERLEQAYRKADMGDTEGIMEAAEWTRRMNDHNPRTLDFPGWASSERETQTNRIIGLQ